MRFNSLIPELTVADIERGNMVPVTMNITGGSSGWDIENTVKRLEIMNFMEFPAKGAFLFDEVLLDWKFRQNSTSVPEGRHAVPLQTA